MNRLDDLVFYIKSEGEPEKVINMHVDHDGISMYSEDKKLTTHELHYMSAIAFVYIGAHLKELILKPEFILEKAYLLYKGFIEGKYKGLQTISDMSIDEFNEMIKKYNGRTKK